MHLTRAINLLVALLLVIHTCGATPASADRYPMPANLKKAWGYIDRGGHYVIPPKFDSASDFSCGAAAVAPDKDRYSDYNDLLYDYIDKTGAVISHNPQSRDQQLHSGLCPMRSESGWGYVNAQGTFKIAPRFEEAREFTADLAPVREKGHEQAQEFHGNLAAVRWKASADPSKG